MPRAHGLGINEGIFHLTHRCHNRQHLLKFARDRNSYRSKLREALREFEVALLDYCLTSNHVHLLVDVADRREISGLMQKVAGETARAYNRRKGRSNAFWGDNYHATMVEGGGYLWRCLVYIELNMVRCGVVAHPKEWEWVGYHEIMGQRQRCRRSCEREPEVGVGKGARLGGVRRGVVRRKRRRCGDRRRGARRGSGTGHSSAI